MLGEIEFGRKHLFESDCSLAAAALNPGMLKYGKVLVDVDNLHVPLAHAHASVLQATARQHDFRLTGELVSCLACSMAKGNRAPTDHMMARVKRPIELIHIDTAGPFPASLGVSRYVVMIVDSASHLQYPYGTRDESEVAILAVVKRFIADMRVPRAFRSDNEDEYTNH